MQPTTRFTRSGRIHIAYQVVGEGPFDLVYVPGWVSHVVAQFDDANQKLAYARKLLEARLMECSPVRCKATLDGNDISGDYLLLEAMNIRHVGSNLELAPDADPGDGLLDVVAVSPAKRDELRSDLAGEKKRKQPPGLPTHRGRVLRIEWTDFDVHFDDDVWPESRPLTSQAKSIDVKLEDERVEFLVPR